VQAFATIPGATGYMMVARGVFKETTKSRQQPMEPEARAAGGGGEGRGRRGGRAGGAFSVGGQAGAAGVTDAQKQSIRDDIEEFLKPYMRA